MSEPNLKTKTANINNKRLFKEIDDFMMEVFTTIGLSWSNKEHRSQFVEMIDDWMEQFAEASGKIIQWDIQCDSRNNTPEDFISGNISFILRYRQKNCFNTTEIEYKFASTD